MNKKCWELRFCF